MKLKATHRHYNKKTHTGKGEIKKNKSSKSIKHNLDPNDTQAHFLKQIRFECSGCPGAQCGSMIQQGLLSYLHRQPVSLSESCFLPAETESWAVMRTFVLQTELQLLETITQKEPHGGINTGVLSQAAIILLYDVMVVNNWQVFLDAYSRYVTG